MKKMISDYIKENGLFSFIVASLTFVFSIITIVVSFVVIFIKINL